MEQSSSMILPSDDVAVFSFNRERAMPIQLDYPIRAYDQEAFHAIDRKVMGIVFDVHNEFGPFLDELLYKREIATRCLEANLPVTREFGIHVSHGSFKASYFVDLLIAGGVVYEAKTAVSLAPPHKAQTLNYLYLTATHHGKLFNLRTPVVQWEFASTQLTNQRRREIQVVEIDWHPYHDSCRWFQSQMIALLEDWGAFLEITLYRNAITYFLGGPAQVIRPIPICSEQRIIGEQKCHLLAPDTAFAISAVTDDRRRMELHLSRFLKHTPLRSVVWVNLNHHQIEFSTLQTTSKS